MKKIIGWLCIVSILITSIGTVPFVSFAATPSTATVTDVYASGNWTVGQQVTANYTYYDPSGKPQVGGAIIEWWRTKNLAGSGDEVKVSDSATYTIRAEDKGGLYFTVTVSNEDGAGKVFYSPVYLAEDTNASATKPVKKKLHLILTGGARSYAPGAVVRAVHNTAFTNLKSEGATTYMWRIKDSRSGDYTVRARTQTYTITEEDYGKWLECAVTVKDADGNSSDQVTAIVFVGNLLDFDSTLSVSKTYNNKPNLINRLWYQSADSIYTYKNTEPSITIDAKDTIKFDGFNLFVKGVASNLKISYSSDNSAWTDLPLSGTTTGEVKAAFTSDVVLKARYFRVSFKSISSSYGIFYEAYPYLTAEGRTKNFVADIQSVGYGAVVDNQTLTISKVTNGIPAKTFAESIVAASNAAVVSVVDKSGAAVTNAQNVKLTQGNIANYRIKVTCNGATQLYNMESASVLKKIDFSNMPDNKKYTEKEINGVSTGYTRDIPGTSATYWYSSGTTIDKYSYGIREDIGNGSALKIVTNNNGKSEVAALWSGVTGIDAEGCYSFSFKVKPGAASRIKVNGRPNTKVSGPGFQNNFVELNATGLSVYNGTELVDKGEFDKDEWHYVEIVVDYKNNKNSVWVDGINYANNVPFAIGSGEYNKTGLQMKISVFQGTGGANDVSYIKDIVFQKTWDVQTGITPDMYNTERPVLKNSDMNSMLISGEKIITSESAAAKKEHVADYISCTPAQFSATVKNALPKTLEERSDIEIQLCRLAQLYVSEGKADYANKVYDALVQFANNHFVIKKSNTIEYFTQDGSTLQPIYPAIAYSLLGDLATSTFDTTYNTDTRALIESWLADTVDITYKQFVNYTAGNMTGFTVKHVAGIATILNNPSLMRKAIYIIDRVTSSEFWFADGIWWEGTASYSKQIYGNLKEILPLMSRFVDPEWYVDGLLNITLDGTDISSRFPMLKAAENVVKTMVNPDGTLIAVNDTHPSHNSVVGKDLPISEANLNNVELNHFGLFALKSGNTENAQQVSLLFPPMLTGSPFSGGHYHGSFLTINLWAAGQELLPDAGYPFKTENHRAFHTAVVSHNGSFIWDDSVERYSNYQYLSARPNLLRYDDGTESEGNIQLIEAQQLMNDDIGVKDKKRLLMQIKTSENTSYVFDLQTLMGGDVHENFLRGSEDEGVKISTTSTKTGNVSNLGVYLKEKGKGGLMAEQTLFTGGILFSGDDMNFTFTGETSGSKLNAFVKGVEGSMSAFSTMPSHRRTGGDPALRDDFPTKHFYQRREVSADDVTHFAAVYEGVSASDNAYVDNVSWYETENAVFAVIDLGEFEDVICISDNLSTKEFEGIVFKTSVGWVRRTKNDKKVNVGYINGGGEIYADGRVFNCRENFESKIQLIDSDELGENIIQINDNIPEELVGKWANLTFSDNSGLSFKLTDADGKKVSTHNDIGFEFSNREASFTYFPSLEKNSGNLNVGMNNKYSEFSDRTINGDVRFKVYSSFYGEPEIRIVVTENGADFKSLKSGSQYTVTGYSNEDFVLYAVLFKNGNLYKAFVAEKGENIQFSPDANLFKSDESGKAPDVYLKCMIWDKNLSPLCESQIKR